MRILALLLASLLVSAPPTLAETSVPQREVVALARRVQGLQADGVVQRVQALREEKPVVLFVYTSWCPYCREMMRHWRALFASGALEEFHPVFLSLDTDLLALSRYLLEEKYAGLYTPYVLRRAGLVPPVEALRDGLGIDFGGGIPYTAFIGRDGTVAAEAIGVLDHEALLAHLKNLAAH